MTKTETSRDMFITRVYTHKGISVVVNIDLIGKTISLVEKQTDHTFQDKRWKFIQRELKYMQGWLDILDAMKFAVTEASKVLQEADERDFDDFANLMLALSHKALKK